jgi:uncharacterized metal-binding protein
MADGITHGRITVAVTAITLPVVFITTFSPLQAMLFGAGCLLGLVVEPDLDVNRITESERRLLRTFGPVAYIWIGLWLPYAIALPHRSPLSHMPILGTLLRLAYALGWLWLLCNALGMWNWLFVAVQANLEALEWLVLGLCIVDMGHWIADWKIFSEVWHSHKGVKSGT